MSVRRIAKIVAFGVAFVLVLPLIVLTWIEKKLGGEVVFVTVSQLLSLLPGPLGNPFRAAYYAGVLDECSWEVNIGFGSQFTHRQARVASHVSTGRYCIIGHAVIESNVRFASRVSVPSGKRQHLGDGGAVVEGTHFDSVRIGAGSWVGEGAIVLADIGRGCIVAAGAVVVRPVADEAVVGGNPAKDLHSKTRNSQDAS
jgi:acetyltransferase-like isoleucine patch superfamily enzyme